MTLDLKYKTVNLVVECRKKDLQKHKVYFLIEILKFWSDIYYSINVKTVHFILLFSTIKIFNKTETGSNSDLA